MAAGKLPAEWEAVLRRAIAFHREHRRITYAELDALVPRQTEVSAKELEDLLGALMEQGVELVDDE